MTKRTLEHSMGEGRQGEHLDVLVWREMNDYAIPTYVLLAVCPWNSAMTITFSAQIG